MLSRCRQNMCRLLWHAPNISQILFRCIFIPCTWHTLFHGGYKERNALVLGAFTLVCLLYGDDHSSWPIFEFLSITPGHLTHESAEELFDSMLWTFRSDFIAACSLPSLQYFRRTSAAVMVLFFFPKCTSCVSGSVIMTGFERSLKYSFHLPRMSLSSLSKTPFLLFDGFDSMRSFPRRPRTVCQNMLLAFQ